jgi:hypothetical protein
MVIYVAAKIRILKGMVEEVDRENKKKSKVVDKEINPNI